MTELGGRRGRLLARAQALLERQGAPRFEMGLMLTLAGGAAFGGSVVLLRLGVDLMSLRYPLSALAGYLVFLLLLRIWIAIRTGKQRADPDFDVSDGGDGLDLGTDAVEAGVGDGATGGAFDIDVGDAVFVLVVLALLLGVLVSCAFVIAQAPVLLAELLVDGAVVSSLYKKLGPMAETFWLERAFSRTWKPLVVIVVLLSAFGWALQLAAPAEVTAGAALRSWLGSDGGS